METVRFKKNFKYKCVWAREWYRLRETLPCKKYLSPIVAAPAYKISVICWKNRTFKLLVVPSQKRYIFYLDENSLYPALCKQQVWKIPEELHQNFDDLNMYFVIAHVRILPQQNI